MQGAGTELPKVGRIGRNHVEGHGGHRHHHRPDDNESPVGRERVKNFSSSRAMLAGCELIRFLQGAPQPK